MWWEGCEDVITALSSPSHANRLTCPRSPLAGPPSSATQGLVSSESSQQLCWHLQETQALGVWWCRAGQAVQTETRGCPPSQCWSKPGAVSSVKGPSCQAVGWGRGVHAARLKFLSEGSSAGHPPANHLAVPSDVGSALKQRLLKSALRQQEELITRSILPTRCLPSCLCRVRL